MTSSEKTWGPWQSLERIATGRTCEIHRATGDGKLVALKVLRHGVPHNRLAHEARILESLDHPGVPKVVGIAEDHSWLALEIIEGRLIAEWSKEKTVAATLDCIISLLDIIQYLHGMNVIHGDLSPTNVLVRGDGTPVIIDFGLARVQGEAPSEEHGFRGTLGFCAPELMANEVPTTSTDIYGAGAVAYAMLTGSPPFMPPDPAAYAWLPNVSIPRPPSSHRPTLSPAMDSTILGMLARDADARPKELRELQLNLKAIRDEPGRKPILGMGGLREELRRACVEVLDGETRIFVLYGPPGCGRSTLATELMRIATVQGIEVIDPKTLEDVSTQGRPIATTLKVTSEEATGLAHAAIDCPRPVLLILQTSRPVPSLREHGAVERTVPPLDRTSAQRIAFVWGVPEEASSEWWRESQGHPESFHALLRHWRKEQGHAVTEEPYSEVQTRILESLDNDGPSPLTRLARALVIGEHELLDHCERLFFERRIEATEDGEVLLPVRDA